MIPGRITVLLSLFALARAQHPSDLVSSLLPSGGNTSLPNVHGQSLLLPGTFSLTILSNESHALVTFNTTTPLDKIGWLAVGFGSAMTDSGMVVLWPSSSTPSNTSNGGTNWTLSLRESSGHSDPKSTTASPVPSFSIVSSLSRSSPDYTTVSFLRPLLLPSAQTYYSSKLQHLNLSRTSSANSIIWASSSRRPSSNDLQASIQQHDSGNFGFTHIDLSKSYADSSNASAVIYPLPAVPALTRYDIIVYAHAGAAMIIWLLVSPVAVLIGRLGRSMNNWFTFHSSIQGFVTLPATIGIVVLGVIASQMGSQSGWNFHKVLGFLILVVLVIQIGLGYYSHTHFEEKRESRPKYNVLHMVLGIILLVGTWVQIYLGFIEYTGRSIAISIKTLFYILIAAFIVFYLISLVILILARRKEGRTWKLSILGLGRSAASVTKFQEVDRSNHYGRGELDAWH